MGDNAESEDITQDYPDPTPSDPNHQRKVRSELSFVLVNGNLQTFHDLLPKEERGRC